MAFLSNESSNVDHDFWWFGFVSFRRCRAFVTSCVKTCCRLVFNNVFDFFCVAFLGWLCMPSLLLFQ